ncbi:MAG: abortive infection family protein [Microvirga sp.]
MGFRRVFRVNYLGTIRNRPGDSHGQGGRPVRPRPRHAQLVVNLAGAMSTFCSRLGSSRTSGLESRRVLRAAALVGVNSVHSRQFAPMFRLRSAP